MEGPVDRHVQVRGQGAAADGAGLVGVGGGGDEDAGGDLPARAGALRGAELNQFSSGAKACLDEPG